MRINNKDKTCQRTIDKAFSSSLAFRSSLSLISFSVATRFSASGLFAFSSSASGLSASELFAFDPSASRSSPAFFLVSAGAFYYISLSFLERVFRSVVSLTRTFITPK